MGHARGEGRGGPANGSKPREVLLDKDGLEELWQTPSPSMGRSSRHGTVRASARCFSTAVVSSGSSAQQASKVLKLKELVLVAFEEGDWEHIPQSGYAQGMLSSYARYLGLNPRTVVDLFQEELYEHDKRHGEPRASQAYARHPVR